MSAWTNDELARVRDAEELQLASRRPDGSLSSFTTMWVVQAGDELYVRSAGGPDRLWYRRAIAYRRGRIRACGVERDVTFSQADAMAQAAVDDAYHVKYDRHGPGIVGHVTGPNNHEVTVRLIPQDDGA